MANLYHVRVIPDLDKGKSITRKMAAQDEAEAAGLVLHALGGAFVDCIEVKQEIEGRKAAGKVAFHACLYGMVQGFLYTDRFEFVS